MRSAVTLSLSAIFAYWLTQILSLTSQANGFYVLTRYEKPRFGSQNPNFFSTNADRLTSPINQKNDNIAESFQPEPAMVVPEKRNANAMKPLPTPEHVCNTNILRNYQPTHGHEQDGSKVEIQQDSERSFSATFVECENKERNECHGIDNALFTSECVTLYEFRQAGVRPAGSSGPFALGFIKVPITCQCRLRRKMHLQ
ncbi:hypothetical protein L596_011609 [Steinernema carpocapsae]|uniref:Uncharacterized protein n=1 Tax=Steinernema carpocapsae TaxID=34508 RepID=A0A4U5NVD3_STECR|nr:hypothetical protein L596_011609 [Steinernema carpocapsae]